MCRGSETGVWLIGIKKGLGFCEVGLGILDGIVRAVGGGFDL